ncbi:flavodoxin family protein [bacterium]|nr:flavodoxin family protein [bacterium]
MLKVLVVYYSRTGNTGEMSKYIKAGIENEGVEAAVKHVNEVDIDEFFDFQGIIVGSAVHYGTMASEIKQMFDNSAKLHGALVGKVGGAFSASINVGGGNETTIIDILRSMLIHGMIIQGMPGGDHYGPVSVGEPDERSIEQCKRYGTHIANLVKTVFANK